MEIVALVLAACSLIISIAAYLRAYNSAPRLPASVPVEAIPTLVELPAATPLQGCTAWVEITQDLPQRVVQSLVVEAFLKEDVAVASSEAESDLVVKGSVSCNGYSEIYYTAELSIYFRGSLLCSIIEKPPHGDRPSNLAFEVVDRIKREVEKGRSRGERLDAIRELNL